VLILAWLRAVPLLGEGMLRRSTGSWWLKESVHHRVSSIYASKGLKSGKKPEEM